MCLEMIQKKNTVFFYLLQIYVREGICLLILVTRLLAREEYQLNLLKGEFSI